MKLESIVGDEEFASMLNMMVYFPVNINSK